MSSSLGSHFIAIVTLLDQLHPEEYDWQQVWVILQSQSPLIFYYAKLFYLFGEMKANIEFSRMVSKFLMDRDRAGSLRVDSQTYANLAMYLLKFLSDR